MIKTDLIKLAFRNLWRRKARTTLTIISVVIGTLSIVMMVSLGLGMQESQASFVENMGGVTLLQIRSGEGGGGMMDLAAAFGGSSSKKNANKKLDREALKKISSLEHVTAVLPARSLDFARLEAKSDDYSVFAPVMELDPRYLEPLHLKMSKGRTYSRNKLGEADFGSMVNVFNNEAGMSMFGIRPVKDISKIRFQFVLGQKPVPGQVVPTDRPTYLTLPADIVGNFPGSAPLDANAVFVSPRTAEALRNMDARIESGREEKQDALLAGTNSPLPAAGQVQGETKNKGNSQNTYDIFYLKVDEIANVEAVKDRINNDLGYQCSGNIDIVKGLETQTRIVQFVLGGIGSIALLVAAIGITNTMLMSIYERKKEIGVMKVIGASVGDVRSLFLIESVWIGSFGGVLGLLFSLLISSGINAAAASSLQDMGEGSTRVSIISPDLAIFAVIFSALIGLLAGYIPARKATKLSAIEAIRND